MTPSMSKTSPTFYVGDVFGHEMFDTSEKAPFIISRLYIALICNCEILQNKVEEQIICKASYILMEVN